MKPELIKGGEFIDHRGKISYFNNFDLTPIKRMYNLVHPDISVVRAWQGHEKEQKWFYIAKGSFEIVLIEPDNWESPSEGLVPMVYKIESKDNTILHIPGGYINGFRAIVRDSEMIVFSDLSIEDSKLDDFRYEQGRWYNWK